MERMDSCHTHPDAGKSMLQPDRQSVDFRFSVRQESISAARLYIYFSDAKSCWVSISTTAPYSVSAWHRPSPILYHGIRLQGNAKLHMPQGYCTGYLSADPEESRITAEDKMKSLFPCSNLRSHIYKQVRFHRLPAILPVQPESMSSSFFAHAT